MAEKESSIKSYKNCAQQKDGVKKLSEQGWEDCPDCKGELCLNGLFDWKLSPEAREKIERINRLSHPRNLFRERFGQRRVG